MGVFAAEIEIRKPTARAKFYVVGGIMVDTGSELSWVSEKTLRDAGISVRKKNQPFVMANGDKVVGDLGYAVIRYGGFETIDGVVFAQETDLQLLRSRTLEGFTATVDPASKRLVSAGPMLAVVACRSL